MRDYIMQSFARKWKEWKATAKAQGFTPYKTTQERLLHRPQRVEENQWRRLVHYWEGEKAKCKSEKNKASRALLTMPHIARRKSLPQVREEMTIKNNGVEPTRREVFKETHFKNGKATSEAAAQAIKDMDNLHAQNPESSQTGFVRDDIYGQVMGSERHGRVWTLGLGPTPSTIFGASYRQLQTERRDTEVRHQQELERMRVQMEAENERMKANMEAEIQRVREEMNLHMQQNEQTRTEIEVMKQKESATRDEIEIMQAQMRDLLAHIRNSTFSVPSPQDVSSAPGQVPDGSSGDHQAQMPQVITQLTQRQSQSRAAVRPQVITQTQLLNFREDCIGKKARKK